MVRSQRWWKRSRGCVDGGDIYIYRERERERKREIPFNEPMTQSRIVRRLDR